MQEKKSKKANLERRRGTFFQLGLIITMAITLFAFEWKTDDVQSTQTAVLAFDALETEIAPVHVIPQQPKIQPKKYDWTKLPVIDPNLPVEPSPDLEPKPEPIPDPGSYDPNALLGNEPTEPIEPQEFFIVENMPHFKDCENDLDKDAQSECTEARFMNEVAKRIEIPRIWIDAGGRSATAYVSFLVNYKGEITDVSVMNADRIHESLSEEAIRAVAALPEMIPGKQRGKAVNVRYRMPIKFKVK